jgi:type IV pilus assembly protein PilW
MVAIAVALILLAGVLQLFVSNKKAYRVQEGASLLNENFRYAISQLEYSIRMAGHWGGAKESAIRVRDEVAPQNDCASSPAFKNLSGAAQDIAFGVEGFDGSATPPIDCIPQGQYFPGTDVLLVRYASASRECLATTRSDETACIASNPDLADQRMLRAAASYGADLFVGKDFSRLYGPNGTSTSPDIMPVDSSADRDLVGNYTVNFEVYFVRRCNTPTLLNDKDAEKPCSGSSADIPTLSRLVLRGDRLTLEDLVSGVEQFQVTYGVDDDSDRAPNRFVNAAEARAGDANGSLWNRVTAARLSLVMRNNEKDASHSEGATIYRLYGGEDGSAFQFKPDSEDAGLYHRRAFSISVQSRNTLRNIR